MASCTEVSPACPVEATVLGYYPNLGAGIFFTAAFGLCLGAAAALSAGTRTWTYGAAIVVGVALEAAGYVGRILLHHDPWNSGAFQLQLCTIILGPTFVCISLYLTLKHAALALGPRLSRLPSAWYPRVFLPADVSCLVVQAIGGGIAATAGPRDDRLLRAGSAAIIAGVALQVAVLALFGLLAADFARRAVAARAPDARRVWADARFRAFVYAVAAAYLAILIRCIYRVAEMAGGWGNRIMQDEPSFLVLDSTLVLVAVILLTVFHPGILFPPMRNGGAAKAAAAEREPKGPEAATSNEGPLTT